MGKDELAIIIRPLENTKPQYAENLYTYVVGRLDQIKAAENNHL